LKQLSPVIYEREIERRDGRKQLVRHVSCAETLEFGISNISKVMSVSNTKNTIMTFPSYWCCFLTGYICLRGEKKQSPLGRTVVATETPLNLPVVLWPFRIVT
jgi:hypothetical protein